jgi:hypothetical protein
MKYVDLLDKLKEVKKSQFFFDCEVVKHICIEVTVATAHPTKNLEEFQHTPAGQTSRTSLV